MDVTPGAAAEEDVANHHDLLRFARHAAQSKPGADDAFVHCPAEGERRLNSAITAILAPPELAELIAPERTLGAVDSLIDAVVGACPDTNGTRRS